MKKKFKSFLAVILAVVMLFSFPLSASAFARKDVTGTYRKSVAKMLRGVDYYLVKRKLNKWTHIHFYGILFP